MFFQAMDMWKAGSGRKLLRKCTTRKTNNCLNCSYCKKCNLKFLLKVKVRKLQVGIKSRDQSLQLGEAKRTGMKQSH